MIIHFNFRITIGFFTFGVIYYACLKLGDLFYFIYQRIARHYTEHENLTLTTTQQPLINDSNRIQETMFYNFNHNADRVFDNDNYRSKSSSDSSIAEHNENTFQSAQTTIVNATVEPQGRSTSTPKNTRQPLAELDQTDCNEKNGEQVEESNETTPITRRRQISRSPRIRKSSSPVRKQPKRSCKKKVDYKD